MQSMAVVTPSNTVQLAIQALARPSEQLERASSDRFHFSRAADSKRWPVELRARFVSSSYNSANGKRSVPVADMAGPDGCSGCAAVLHTAVISAAQATSRAAAYAQPTGTSNLSRTPIAASTSTGQQGQEEKGKAEAGWCRSRTPRTTRSEWCGVTHQLEELSFELHSA